MFEVKILSCGKYQRNYVRVAPGISIPNSRWVWHNHYGEKIPEGYHIHHVNRNTLDDRIENLKKMTIAQHMNVHKLIRRVENFELKFDNFYLEWEKMFKNDIDFIDYRKKYSQRCSNT